MWVVFTFVNVVNVPTFPITVPLAFILPDAVIWPVEIKFDALTSPAALISRLAEIEPTVKLSVITASSLEWRCSAVTVPTASISSL